MSDGGEAHDFNDDENDSASLYWNNIFLDQKADDVDLMSEMAVLVPLRVCEYRQKRKDIRLRISIVELSTLEILIWKATFLLIFQFSYLNLLLLYC